jgi:DNA recombination protein RmuC
MDWMSVLVGLGLGGMLVWIVYSMKSRKIEQDLLKEKEEIKFLYRDMDRLSEQDNKQKEDIKRLEAERSNLDKAKSLLEERLDAENRERIELKKQMEERFKLLAREIFEERSQHFKKQNSESLDTLLSPFKERLSNFEKTIQNQQQFSGKITGELRGELKALMQLNKRLSEEASQLTKALKGDNKTQGNWGETQLEVLLENSGLKKSVHYDTQFSSSDSETGRKIPDFIINLPENKCLILDAKVSLIAYERYFNADNKEIGEQALKEHIQSIKTHIKGLSNKNYQNLYGIHSPDYVLMFVALEPALHAALDADNSLFNFALEKNVVLVSHSTLLATLKTVSFIWKQEDQKRNVLEIARQSGKLYDKFVGFVNDMTTLGNQLDTSQKTYHKAMNKLRDGQGNLIRSTEKLKELGAKTSKSLPKELLD